MLLKHPEINDEFIIHIIRDVMNINGIEINNFRKHLSIFVACDALGNSIKISQFIGYVVIQATNQHGIPCNWFGPSTVSVDLLGNILWCGFFDNDGCNVSVAKWATNPLCKLSDDLKLEMVLKFES